MFVKNREKPLLAIVPGIQRKTLAVGDHTLMTEFILEAGAELPAHKHPHEQIGFFAHFAEQFGTRVLGNVMGNGKRAKCT